ncbi:hypothetical protein [Pseudochryseolinea flava]|uniref:hypothetical protein n=1 Tax=Pseudochryseolinea flava TaxID=2059302 RepID=UPI001057B7DA|nr:hypothetical protein [Pseudochryseolinea flava]
MKRSDDFVKQRGLTTSLTLLQAYLEDDDNILQSFFTYVGIAPASVAAETFGNPEPPGEYLKIFGEASKESAYHKHTLIEPVHLIAAALEVVTCHISFFFTRRYIGYHQFQQFLLERKLIDQARRPWTPENDLERFMAASLYDSAFRPLFTKTLMMSEVFVVSNVDFTKIPNTFFLAPDENSIAIFTSDRRVRDNGGYGATPIEVNRAKFTDVIRAFKDQDRPFQLNPHSGFNWNFSAEWVRSIAAGKPKHTPASSAFLENTSFHSVMHASQLVQSIIQYCSYRKEIDVLHLAGIVGPPPAKETFGLCIGYKIRRHKDEILDELHEVISPFLESDVNAQLLFTLLKPDLVINNPMFEIYRAERNFLDKFSDFFSAKDS